MPGVQDQPGQHSKTLSLQKTFKISWVWLLHLLLTTCSQIWEQRNDLKLEVKRKTENKNLDNLKPGEESKTMAKRNNNLLERLATIKGSQVSEQLGKRLQRHFRNLQGYSSF